MARIGKHRYEVCLIKWVLSAISITKWGKELLEEVML